MASRLPRRAARFPAPGRLLPPDLARTLAELGRSPAFLSTRARRALYRPAYEPPPGGKKTASSPRDLAAHGGEWVEPQLVPPTGATRCTDARRPPQGLAALAAMNLLRVSISSLRAAFARHLHLLNRMNTLGPMPTATAGWPTPVRAGSVEPCSQELCGSPPPHLRCRRSAVAQVGELDGRHHRVRGADAQGKHHERHPEPSKSFSPVVAPDTRVGAPEPGRLLQHRAVAPESLRPCKTGAVHTYRLLSLASIAVWATQHGLRPAGNVPRQVASHALY